MRKKIKSIKQDLNISVAEIIGGLGNQLFIIFTGLAYSFENKKEFKVINGEKNRKTYWDTPLYNKVERLNNFNGNIYREKDHGYNPLPKIENIYLKGYFQSYKYFDNYKKKILQYLEWQTIFDSVKKEYNQYLDCDGFIHFRLGDYKHLECHPVCDIDYYISSLKLIPQKELKILYFFEQEDINIVNDKITILQKEFPQITFIPIDTNIEDYKQVFIMSFLKYCIIANSTFSWWGAYLNNRDDKVVIYPQKWFSGSLNNLKIEDKFPQKWHSSDKKS